MKRTDLEKLRLERLRRASIITHILRRRQLDDGGSGEAPAPAPSGDTRVTSAGDTRITSSGDTRRVA